MRPRYRARGTVTDRAAADVIELYRRHAARWAALRDDRLVETDWLDRFCALLPAGARVLDIGCGAGVPIARELVRRGFGVTGVDGAPEMLALFRRNVPEAAAALADMRALDLADRFAGMLAWDSLFHLSPADQRAMVARFRAHAAPGAALMFTSGPAAGEAIGAIEGEPLYHASLDPADYRALLGAAGFDLVDHVVEDPRCGCRTIRLAQRGDRAAAGPPFG